MTSFELTPIKHLPDTLTARHPDAAFIGDRAKAAFGAARAFFEPAEILTHKILGCRYFVACGRVVCEDKWA